MAQGINELLKDDQLSEKYKKNAQKRSKDFEIENIVNYWDRLLEGL